jgi:NAD(P)-dependent dehydrogenase (short-subunit alcohol dehydrogenase family)
MSSSGLELEQRVALVTGGDSGIGRASSVLLAQRGARVAVLGNQESAVHATGDEIRANGGLALPLLADVRDSAVLERAYQSVVAEWARLDIVLANAGINGVWAPIEEITEAAWDATLGTNLKGTFLTIKHAVPLMKARGGSIVITVLELRCHSLRSVQGGPTRARSNARARACSLQHPSKRDLPGNGFDRDPQPKSQRGQGSVQAPARAAFPLNGEAASPEQIAKLVSFLASDDSAHITGSPIWIDGAESLLWG